MLPSRASISGLPNVQRAPTSSAAELSAAQRQRFDSFRAQCDIAAAQTHDRRGAEALRECLRELNSFDDHQHPLFKEMLQRLGELTTSVAGGSGVFHVTHVEFERGPQALLLDRACAAEFLRGVLRSAEESPSGALFIAQCMLVQSCPEDAHDESATILRELAAQFLDVWIAKPEASSFTDALHILRVLGATALRDAYELRLRQVVVEKAEALSSSPDAKRWGGQIWQALELMPMLSAATKQQIAASVVKSATQDGIRAASESYHQCLVSCVQHLDEASKLALIETMLTRTLSVEDLTNLFRSLEGCSSPRSAELRRCVVRDLLQPSRWTPDMRMDTAMKVATELVRGAEEETCTEEDKFAGMLRLIDTASSRVNCSETDLDRVAVLTFHIHPHGGTVYQPGTELRAGEQNPKNPGLIVGGTPINYPPEIASRRALLIAAAGDAGVGRLARELSPPMFSDTARLSGAYAGGAVQRSDWPNLLRFLENTRSRVDGAFGALSELRA